jgi:hypothetical protein
MSGEFTDEQLLQDYRGNRSDAAFASLVNRYADMVYSAALRQTRNAGLAEEAGRDETPVVRRSAWKFEVRSNKTAVAHVPL